MKTLNGGSCVSLLLATFFAIPGAGCGEQPGPPDFQPPSVTVVKPEVRDVTRYFEYTGNTVAINSVEVVARVSGELISQHYDVLDEKGNPTTVEAGQLLFRIEPDVYEIAVRSAKADVERAKALEKAAEVILQRVNRAIDMDAASDAEQIEAEALYEQRVAERVAAEASLDDAELNLSYTSVKAPIAGEVTRNLVDVGNLVGPGATEVLTRVTQMQPIYVYFDVSEKIVEQYLEREREMGRDVAQEPPPLELATAGDDEGTYPHIGQVDWWDRSVDQGTGTIVVRGRLDNEDLSLVPGLFARVRVPFEELEAAVLVQDNAILSNFSGEYVLVLAPYSPPQQQGGQGAPSDATTPPQYTVEPRMITTIMRTDDGMRVVEGLSPDEEYVTVGIQWAIPTYPVNVTREASEPTATSGETP
ncbi:MAG: efflux RND transporter periplasmic adaptor subunit [Planctomycetota bacterium]